MGKAPGLHPVEMLARIAKFEVVTREKFPKMRPTRLFRENLSHATSHTRKTFEAEAALAKSASRASKNCPNSGDLISIFRCVYDGGIEAFGNGKMDKQAKLVAAWNMIERLKKDNIGIVNETLATGIVVDKSVLKKPVKYRYSVLF